MSNSVNDQGKGVSSIRQIWRHAPPSLRAQVNSTVTSAARMLGQVRGQMERGSARGGPVCVMGMHRAVLGIGRGTRLFQGALEEMGIATTAWDVSELFGKDLTLPAPKFDPTLATSVIAHLNPIEHLHALATYKGPRPQKGFRVGYWAWETSQPPKEWIAGIAALDEIWCPSHFTANSVRGLIGDRRVVRVVPLPIPEGITGLADKARFGISEEKVTLFAACDLRSSLNRKNPLGAIEAFRLSGCGARGQADLLIKVHGDFPGSGLNKLYEEASKVTGVRIMNQKLSPDEMKALRSSIDIVLSPHRSEGFGLILAEAMRAGKPVIATGWSGNMDFMDAQSAALIESKQVPVADSYGVYQIGSWAEPDLAHAATLIEELVNSQEKRNALGQAGLARIAAYSDAAQWQSNLRSLLDLP